MSLIVCLSSYLDWFGLSSSSIEISNKDHSFRYPTWNRNAYWTALTESMMTVISCLRMNRMELSWKSIAMLISTSIIHLIKLDNAVTRNMKRSNNMKILKLYRSLGWLLIHEIYYLCYTFVFVFYIRMIYLNNLFYKSNLKTYSLISILKNFYKLYKWKIKEI